MTKKYACHSRTEFTHGRPQPAGRVRCADGGAQRHPSGRAQWAEPAGGEQGAQPSARPVRRPAVRAARPRHGADRAGARACRPYPRGARRYFPDLDAAGGVRACPPSRRPSRSPPSIFTTPSSCHRWSSSLRQQAPAVDLQVRANDCSQLPRAARRQARSTSRLRRSDAAPSCAPSRCGTTGW